MRVCGGVGVGGGGVVNCAVDHILQEFYALFSVYDQIQNLPN
jgi:hypothetical protein